ncbi:MAG: hypothetical protein JNK05_17280 [Myxococcales bacterium]|nr:hypothetical protein [Myxococcales bacterium]
MPSESTPTEIDPQLRDDRVTKLLAFAAIVVLAPVVLHSRFSARTHVTVRRRPVDEATIPSAIAARALALGHREWAADLLFTAALSYFGESLSTRSQLRFLQSYARTTQEIDPYFRRTYLWGATVSIYTHRRITRQSVEASCDHLQRGLDVFRDDPEMLYALGFNLVYELAPLLPEGEERRAAKRRGAYFLQRAAAGGQGPGWLALTAARMLEESGGDASAIELLRDTLVRTEDPALRARIERRIRDLGGDADPGLAQIRAIEEERRRAFPYVSPALYVFVGPPVRAP